MTIDIDALANVSVNEPMATQMAVVPEGEYTAIIDSFGDEGVKGWMREANTKNGPKAILQVPFVILDDNLKATLGRDKVTVRMDLWLDTANGGLETGEGKNIDLGRLREALGQNSTPNWSFTMLAGAGPVKIQTGVRADRNDPSRKFAEVKRVSKL